MAVWYVSNQASNGWPLGVDTNAGTSMAAAKLTLAAAMSAAQATDTIFFNISTVPYTEGSGATYLSMTCAALIGDPANTSGNQATLRAGTSADRTLYLNSSTAAYIAGLTFDGQNVTGQRGVIINANAPTLSFERCSFVNYSSYLIAAPATNAAVQLDRVTVGTTCTSTTVFNWSAATTITALTVKGGAYYAPSGTSGAFFLNTTSISGNVTFQADRNGGLVDFTGCLGSANIRFGGTVGGNFTISGTKHSGTPGGVFFAGGTVTGAITCSGNQYSGLTTSAGFRLTQTAAGSLTLSGDTYSGTQGYCTIVSRALTACAVRNGTLTVKAGSSGAAIWIPCMGTSSPVIEYNNLACEAPTAGGLGGIQVGADGISAFASNTGARTGTIAFANGTTAVVGQKFTTVAANSSNDQTHLAAIEVYLSKSGSPTGNLTAYLYSDNAGTATTLLATSQQTVSAAGLTTSAALYGFTFAITAATAGTTYWVEWQCTGGTTNASNYLLMDYNTTVTAGSIATGASLPAGTADTTKCLRFQAYSAIYGVSPIIRYNKISVAGGGSTYTQQLITLGATKGGSIYGNQVSGVGYYPYVIKDCQGAATNIWGETILFTTANASNGAAIYGKASDLVAVYHCTISVQGSSAAPACIEIGPGSLNWLNAKQCTNFSEGNNVLLQQSTGNAPVYRLNGSTGATFGTNWVYTTNPTNISDVAPTWGAWQALGYDTGSVGPSTLPPLANATSPASAADFDIPSASAAATLAIGADLRSVASNDNAARPYMAKPCVGAFSWFTGELLCEVSGASAVYAVIRRADGRVWSGTGWEQYQAGRLASYALSLTQLGASQSWVGNFPSAVTDPGLYAVQYRVRAGSAAAESDTIITGGTAVRTVGWSGGHALGVQIRGAQAVAA